jgi:hypothetical protein
MISGSDKSYDFDDLCQFGIMGGVGEGGKQQVD